ncbi:OmpA family protein [bacterium]|nr:OmpA family protein [bacterium]
MMWNQSKRKGFSGQKPKEDDDAWAMTYGDMMSLLLVFFILIVAISTVDPVRMQQVSQQLRESIGGKEEDVPTLKEIEQELKESISQLQIEEVVAVSRDKNGVSLVMRGESFFPSGSATLYPGTASFLNEVAWQIQKNPYMISVEGHSDNIPISTSLFPSNWELSGARAGAVVRYFESRGIRRSRMRIIGWADAKPVDPDVGNSTPQARAQNRRVVITFLNEFAERSVDSAYIPSQP